MKIKKILATSIFLAAALSANNNIGVSINAGKSGSSEVLRASLYKGFDETIYSGDIVSLNGYHDLSYSYWNGKNNTMSSVSYSPVFTLELVNFDIATFKPYLEAGIGISYLSKKEFENKKFGTNFQFEDRVGVGLKNRNLNLYVRYLHYSNAGIKKDNDGLNSVVVGAVLKF